MVVENALETQRWLTKHLRLSCVHRSSPCVVPVGDTDGVSYDRANLSLGVSGCPFAILSRDTAISSKFQSHSGPMMVGPVPSLEHTARPFIVQAQ